MDPRVRSIKIVHRLVGIVGQDQRENAKNLDDDGNTSVKKRYRAKMRKESRAREEQRERRIKILRGSA